MIDPPPRDTLSKLRRLRPRHLRYLLQPLKAFRRHRWGGDVLWHVRRARGIIHVGANTGQERYLYGSLGIPVLWVEPIPSVFAVLEANLAGFAGQRALQALVADADGESRTLNIASNNGESSSIFDLHLHKDIWPEVDYVERVTMTTVTLPTLLGRHRVAADSFDALVLDTQGSELLILKGAAPILRNFRVIVTEASDFEAYRGGARLADIEAFLRAYGYAVIRRARTVRHRSGGAYFDVVFRRR
jgi:FkbM family methyltransferase